MTTTTEKWVGDDDPPAEEVIRRQSDEMAMKNQLVDVERNIKETEASHAEATARRDDLASELTALTAAIQNYDQQLVAAGKEQETVSLQLSSRQIKAKVEYEQLSAAAEAGSSTHLDAPRSFVRSFIRFA